MSTSYADSAQARATDERYFPSRPPRADFDPANFHEYDHEADRARRLEERKASAQRVSAAVDQIGAFWGLTRGKTV